MGIPPNYLEFIWPIIKNRKTGIPLIKELVILTKNVKI